MSLCDLPSFEFTRLPSLDALCALVHERHARGESTVLLAGGTDWMVEQELRPKLRPGESPPLVVDVSRMPDLKGIYLEGDRLRIGAASTYLEMQRSSAVHERAPLIDRMARDIGALQIQARGTLGGNIATASPAADGVAALAAYDAELIVQSVRGQRRIPFAELQTGYKSSTRAPDEIIVAIEIDLPKAGSAWTWRKIGARKAQAISKVALAGIAELQDGRVKRFGLGMASVAPVTARLQNTRDLVLSRPLSELSASDVDEAVSKDISPIDDVRSTRAYRIHCAKAATRSFLRELGAPI